MPSGLNYLDEMILQEKFLQATKYRKKELTLLRKLKEDEVGNQLDTLVKKIDGRIVLEVTNTLEEGDIIARNPIPIGNKNNKAIYNEWIIKENVVAENYQISMDTGLSSKFTSHQKKANIRAIEITEELVTYFKTKEAVEVKLNTLANKPEEVLLIAVKWTKELMNATKGDYLTDQGYVISQDDMQRGYEAIEDPQEEDVAQNFQYR